MSQKIIYTNFVEAELDGIIERMDPSGLFILVDNNTLDRVLPRLQSLCKNLKNATVIDIKPGDQNKNIDSLTYIWKSLSENGATRGSVLINLGGGVVTDIGAFAAATFKRGIRCVNIPTTLLGAVDAAIGGKTGINFHGLKNEIGVFSNAEYVIISTTFFGTLSIEELKSGYAEMLKHGLLADDSAFNDLLKKEIGGIDPDSMLKLVEDSTKIKTSIVERDPTETGLRKALNLGHTVAHAFEALSMQRGTPLAHGYAVAYGLVIAAVLSVMKRRFPANRMRKLAAFVFENYRSFGFDCTDYDRLIEFMHHDKKNKTASDLNFTLLKDVGIVETDCHVTDDEVKAAFDIYREELCK